MAINDAFCLTQNTTLSLYSKEHDYYGSDDENRCNIAYHWEFPILYVEIW